MEKLPNQGKPISPEEFFNTKVEIKRVGAEEFYEIVRENTFYSDKKKILSAKGMGFSKEGKVTILLRTDVFPEEYMPYLETHEKWEAYIVNKEGYNLKNKADREYNEKNGFNIFSRFGTDYNFDFGHEYAVYKEYEDAMKDGKLDEFHKWILDLREKEKPMANEGILKLIENDTKIRESIYKKLKEGTKHSFTRN